MSRGSYIVNLQWFYSAVDGERRFFTVGAGKKGRATVKCYNVLTVDLQCGYCKTIIYLL